MIRQTFTSKYADLPERWSISSDIVLGILSKYEKQLTEELEKLKTEKMSLPKFFKDKRTDAEYIYDIIDGWVMEDIICYAWLKTRLQKTNSNIEIKIAGTDNDRQIQKHNSNNITTNPDIVVSIAGKDVCIELQMARRALVNGYDMKETKVQRAMKEGNFFLWVIVPENKFFILNPQIEMSDRKPEANPFWDGKMVYHIDQAFITNIGGYANMKDDLTDTFIAKLGV